MKKHLNKLLRGTLILLPLVLAVALFAWFTRISEDAPRKSPQEKTQVLRVIQVPTLDVVPRVLGYGTAQPDRVWRAVARVAGQVVYVNPMLRAGAVLEQHAELLRIDPTTYEIAVLQARADIQRIEAELAQLDQQTLNDHSSLKIEEASLEVAERDLERSRNLLAKDAISQAKFNTDERATFSQRQRVQTLRNSLSLAPATRAAREGALAASRAALKRAELDLSYTVVKAPFTAVLADVRIEEGQFVAVSEMLFEAYGAAAAKVDAQIPHDKIRRLLDPNALGRLNRAVRSHEHNQALKELFDATVRFYSGASAFKWEGHLAGVRELVDESTRTIGLTVIVDNPYKNARPEDKPPLVKGTFCEVELRGPLLRNQVVVPRAAVHAGHVYVLDAASRLERRSIITAFSQSNFVVVADGLRSGETLVVSGPTPAIEGLLVHPMEDSELLDSLRRETAGEVRLR